jgi:hypothetical protein
MRTARATLTLRWLPVLAGLAYVGTVVALGSQLVRDNDWDTDVSAPFALAEQLRGHGPVHIPHYGEWTTFWWLLATRALPWHEEIWEASGYALAVGTALLLGWATARVAGRWAGVTAAATALLVGPFALRALLSLASHVTNPVGVVVLGAALVLLTRTRSWLLVVVVGLVAGTNAASDGLLWIAGIVPFALAAALLAWTTRRRDVALRAAGTLAVAVATALATTLAMHLLDFHVVGFDRSLSQVQDLPGNVRHLVRMVAFLGGANYAIPGAYPHEPLRAVIAMLTVVGVVAPVVAAVKLRRASPELQAYACYWAAVAGLLCIVFVITPNATALGPKSVNYLLALAPAAGAGVALLAMHSRSGQVAVALAVAAVGAVNIAGVANGRAGGVPTIGQYAQPIRDMLENDGVTRGYAGYWTAQNLSWQTDMHLLVAPVVNCGAQLCPYNFFTIRSWYERQGGPTFLLVDNSVIHRPPFVSEAREMQRFGPLEVYVFDYDIARQIK